MVYNGKIESIRITDGDNVEIKLRWIASMPYMGQDGFGTWTKVEDERMLTQLFPNLMVPYVIEDTPDKGERVRFGTANILYFEDRDNLDPSTIEGMEPSDYE